ncbi:MAG: Holliday junction branch migration protein RuvA [Paracoccaceae bacterium]
MIGRLSGRLAYAAADHVMIDVGGVGYVVHVSDRTRMALPPVGEAVSLWTDLLVREDLLQLMGFTTLVEKEWYRLLTTVQGVGAKSALGIVGALGPDGVSRAIALGDWASIKAAPGVGPKIAQRVVNELKDKAPGVMAMGATAPAVQAGPAVSGAVIEPVPMAPPGGASPAQAEAMSALGNLGYAPAEAARAVAEALDEAPGADTAALIRASLKRLAPKG